MAFHHQMYDAVFVPTSALQSDVHFILKNGKIRHVKQKDLATLPQRPTLIIW